MRSIVTVLLAGSLVGTAVAQEIVEPRSGVRFAPKMGPTSLLGMGVRSKMMGRVKVYAAGLYVADSALAGPLAAYKGQANSPAFYQALVSGDFEKAMVLKFVRDVSTDQVRDAFRDALKGANAAKVDLLLGYFSDTKNGQEYVFHLTPAGALEVRVAGLNKVPIKDKAFAASVFGIWLGEKPIQDDLKKDLIARAGELLK
jgi:hypothetical protein